MSGTRVGLGKGPRLFVLFAVVICTSAGGGLASARPANVTKEGDAWLNQYLGAAMPSLLQTEYGPVDPQHVFVVDDLGDWGAARAKGGHQGTDFVLDLPHVADESGRVYVGSIVDGKVVHVFPSYGAYGNTVFVHRGGAPNLVFIFAHLDSVYVDKNETIEVGDLLGVFGCSGNCRGLAGQHVRNQVHVEVYDMPADFTPDMVDWDSRPMRQLRALAQHTPKKPHGIDVAAYLGGFKLGSISRAELGERYNKNAGRGGLDKYLEKVGKEKEKAACARSEDVDEPVGNADSVEEEDKPFVADEVVPAPATPAPATATPAQSDHAIELATAGVPPEDVAAVVFVTSAGQAPAIDEAVALEQQVATEKIEAAEAILERLQALEASRSTE